MYAGKAYATVRWEGEPQMATLRPNVFAAGHAGRRAQGRGRDARTVDAPRARARVVEVKATRRAARSS